MIIIHESHQLARLIEHYRLLHGGLTAVTSVLSRPFDIIGGRKVVRNIIRQCVNCRRVTATPLTQRMGNLPVEWITPDHPFAHVGLDYAGPFHVKYGYVRKPTLVKVYVCVFVLLSVKAVHLDLVIDLTTEAFIACLRRFIARRGKPNLIRSDNGTNFIGTNPVLKELFEFLNAQKTKREVAEFCSSEVWNGNSFLNEHLTLAAFGRQLLRYTSVRSLAKQSSVLKSSILNSRPLTLLPEPNECLEVLTPGHFHIGRSLQTLPNHSASYQSNSL